MNNFYVSFFLFLSISLNSLATSGFISIGKNNKLMSSLKASMNYSLQRQMVLSQNISSQDVPGYKSRDLKAVNFNKLNKFNLRSKINTAKTNIGHIGIGNIVKNYRFKERKNTKFNSISITENDVDIAEQMIKVNENLNDYNMSTSIYKKMHGLVKIAIGAK